MPRRSLKIYIEQSHYLKYMVLRRCHHLYMGYHVRGHQLYGGTVVALYYNPTVPPYNNYCTKCYHIFSHMYHNRTIPVHKPHIYSTSLAAKTHNFEVRFTPRFYKNHASVNAWIVVSDWYVAQNLVHGYCMIVVCSKPRAWLSENHWTVRSEWLARVTLDWKEVNFQQWITNPVLIFSFKTLNYLVIIHPVL